MSYLIRAAEAGPLRAGPRQAAVHGPVRTGPPASDRPGAPTTSSSTPRSRTSPRSPWPPSARAGASPRSARIFRGGQEFYGMREYMTGDDLRRIHWPSTARTGQLMIRQEEVARRAVVPCSWTPVPPRWAATAPPRSSRPCRRRPPWASSWLAGDSPAAGDARRPPRPADRGGVPGAAGLGLGRADPLARPRAAPAEGQGRGRLDPGGRHRPAEGPEVTALIRAASGYGPKMAVFVYPKDPKVPRTVRERSDSKAGRPPPARRWPGWAGTSS